MSIHPQFLSYPQANSVEKILVVRDVRVLLGNIPTGSKEHPVGHLPTGKYSVSLFI